MITLNKYTRTYLTAALGFAVLILLLIGVTALVNDEAKTNEPASASASKVSSIQITAIGFEPAAIKVKRGTKIIWTNSDKSAHQVVSNPHPLHTSLAELKSEILNHQQSYEYTADKTGSFNYHDEIDPTRNGQLEVIN